jgi:hypothetical protein
MPDPKEGRSQEPQWELVEHPSYSPDFAPSDIRYKTTLVTKVSLMMKSLKQRCLNGCYSGRDYTFLRILFLQANNPLIVLK